jgi:hypothetical protein
MRRTNNPTLARKALYHFYFQSLRIGIFSMAVILYASICKFQLSKFSRWFMIWLSILLPKECNILKNYKNGVSFFGKEDKKKTKNKD